MQAPGIGVAQIFLERATFAHRDDFLALPIETKPAVGNVGVEITAGESDDARTGIFKIHVFTDPNQRPIYNVDLAMVALLHVSEKQNLSIGEFVTSPAAVSLLYPFVREVFASLTLRGRFGPVWLNLINPVPIAADLRARRQGREAARNTPEASEEATRSAGASPSAAAASAPTQEPSTKTSKRKRRP